MVNIKSKKEIEAIKESCRVTALVHLAIEKEIRVGVTTEYLDNIAEKTFAKYGAIPSCKGYPSGQEGVPNFPKGTCISINEEVIHGIPGKRVLKDGDIVSIDLSAYKNGYHGDAARTYIVGVTHRATRI